MSRMDSAASLATSHPVAFSATSHPEQARDFYGNTLGLALVSGVAVATDA